MSKDRCCEFCYNVPELTPVILITESTGISSGVIYCPMCKWVVSAWNCPYIPECFIERKINE